MFVYLAYSKSAEWSIQIVSRMKIQSQTIFVGFDPMQIDLLLVYLNYVRRAGTGGKHSWYSTLGSTNEQIFAVFWITFCDQKE